MRRELLDGPNSPHVLLFVSFSWPIKPDERYEPGLVFAKSTEALDEAMSSDREVLWRAVLSRQIEHEDRVEEGLNGHDRDPNKLHPDVGHGSLTTLVQVDS